MQFTVGASLLTIAAMIQGMDAFALERRLGINCRGSSECGTAAGNSVNQLIATMQSASSAGHGSDTFSSGRKCIPSLTILTKPFPPPKPFFPHK